jgi:hypothetical protein
MWERLTVLITLLLAVGVGAGAQTPTLPASATGQSVASASRATASAPASPARADRAASGQRFAAVESHAPATDGRPERHWLGMPLKWVVAGAVVVAMVVTLAVVAHNRTKWRPCHYAHPDPCE